MNALGEPNFDAPGDSAEIAFAFNAAAQRYEVIAARRISRSTADTAGATIFDLRSCPAGWQFTRCEQKHGASGRIESAPLKSTHAGWFEVAIQAQTQSTNNELALSWPAANGGWTTNSMSRIALVADNSIRTYHFYTAPADGGVPVDQLHVEATDIRVKQIIIREVP